MPIYEYQCTKCGEIFEAFQKVSDEPLTECRFCKARVEKLISHSSFQLKGSGWYLTDYAKRSSSPSGTETSNSSASPSKPAESGSTAGAGSTVSESKV
ncbi:MAG: zinc ribbon domain-containing protein [Acidobacteria bacterium]|nr:zinc ribbon domain-containing protein [Acidobacteriota bacterium]